MAIETLRRRPEWLKIQLPHGQDFSDVRKIIRKKKLHTVCQSAHCPNLGECWSRRTATFMIMGNLCTHNCRFCAVQHGKPDALDPYEPIHVAEAVKELDLRYAVITSVTRDDLDDGGAEHFAKTIRAIKDLQPRCKVEVLIPDFQGSDDALMKVLAAKPDVLNHNIETIPRLYPKVRPQANFERSLHVLRFAREMGFRTKSGMMVGLGERFDEIKSTLDELSNVDCQMLTVGQYLQPSRHHLSVERYLHPDEFEEIKRYAKSIGFTHVESGPLVRSSYHADQQFREKLEVDR